VKTSIQARNANDQGSTRNARHAESVAHSLRLPRNQSRPEQNYRAVWGWNRGGPGGKSRRDHDTATLLRESRSCARNRNIGGEVAGISRSGVQPRNICSPRPGGRKNGNRRRPRVSIPALGPYPRAANTSIASPSESPLRGGIRAVTADESPEQSRTAIECGGFFFSRKHPRRKEARSFQDREAAPRARLRRYAYEHSRRRVPAFHRQPFVP